MDRFQSPIDLQPGSVYLHCGNVIKHTPALCFMALERTRNYVPFVRTYVRQSHESNQRHVSLFDRCLRVSYFAQGTLSHCLSVYCDILLVSASVGIRRMNRNIASYLVLKKFYCVFIKEAFDLVPEVLRRQQFQVTHCSVLLTR